MSTARLTTKPKALKKTGLPSTINLVIPVLEVLAAESEAPAARIRALTISHLRLEEDDLLRLTTNGAPVFNLRFSWAITFLVKAEFVLRLPVDKGLLITKSGREFLKEHPNGCTQLDLMQNSDTFARWKRS